jgi:carbon-monoxide dehydrogenase medium subunit
VRAFHYLQPASLEETVSLLNEHGEAAKLMAGGQSLLLLMREGLVQPEVVIDLARVTGLNEIGPSADQVAIEIGALVTHRQVEQSPLIQTEFPPLAEAYQVLASVPVRNFATTGGNLAHNAPGSDPPPMLVALGAEVALHSRRGRRALDVESFGTGYYETALAGDEVLTGVMVPRLPPGSGFAYRKYAVRPMDMAIVGVAALVTLEAGQCRQCRIALTGVAPTTIRARRAEAAVLGQTLSEQTMAGAAEIALGEIDPISDVHASADYRRMLTAPAVRRVVSQAWQRALAASREGQHE